MVIAGGIWEANCVRGTTWLNYSVSGPCEPYERFLTVMESTGEVELDDLYRLFPGNEVSKVVLNGRNDLIPLVSTPLSLASYLITQVRDGVGVGCLIVL